MWEYRIIIAHSRIQAFVREAKLYLIKTEPYFTVLWPTCAIFLIFSLPPQVDWFQHKQPKQ